MFTNSEVKGFAFRVNASGSKTFLFNYRFGGKGRRLVLGQYGELTLAHARKLAEAAYGKVLAGGHPAEEKKAVAQAFQQQAIEDARQAAANALTFEALIDRWTSNALRDSSESHRTEAPRRLRLNFADMLNRPAHALPWRRCKPGWMMWRKNIRPLAAACYPMAALCMAGRQRANW